ncbi:nucleotide-diphospho-sugar transferase [Earliella scabrosa]|nr:nucleotide-diphospho-sugar transferase [Earliella scabrosa]
MSVQGLQTPSHTLVAGNQEEDCITFAILLPIPFTISSFPQNRLDCLRRFAKSLADTTTDDTLQSGGRYRVRIYFTINHDNIPLEVSSNAESIFREYGFSHIVALEPLPRSCGHVCALLRDCARRAYQDHCDYYIISRYDAVWQDANWMSSIHHTFEALSSKEGVPLGIGCVALTNTTLPATPTHLAIHRTHMDIFRGEVIPECFTTQEWEWDQYLFQLYRRWGCAATIHARIRSELVSSGAARHDEVHTANWTYQPLDNVTAAVEAWLRRRSPAVERTLTLDVIVPCYRVDLRSLDAFLALQPSDTCSVNFIIIVDNPQSPNIGDLLLKHGHRPDVRIRINEQNLGASASRNRGLDESAAEWVHFLDDDVIPDTNLLIEAEKAIRAHPDAAGFVGTVHFPSADTVFTAAVHLSGATYFWDIASKITEDVPWGVTANLIVRRNIRDGVVYDLQFPKTGGGEDVDFCCRKRASSLAQGRQPLHAAPDVKVTHPWWHGGHRSYWRFYMWAKGDAHLMTRHPQHTYRDTTPDAAECLLLSYVVFLGSLPIALLDRALALRVVRTAMLTARSVVLANIAHDLYHRLLLHPERHAGMKTTVRGARWVCAVVEASLIKMFARCGRVVGILERGDFGLLLKRFDWFCGRLGNRLRKKEMANNRVRMALSVIVFALLVRLRIQPSRTDDVPQVKLNRDV